MRRRLGWFVISAVLAGAAVPAAAAPEPHVVDARGDAVVAAQDIVSASFDTVTTPRGRALEIRVELAGAPAVDAGLYWEVGWTSPGCELSYIEYSRSSYGPGVQHAELIQQCKAGGSFKNGMPATGRLEGSTLVLTTPLGRRFRPGMQLSQPFAASFGFVALVGGVPSYYQADETAKGRPYRVERD